jgi:hypothetical protein
VFFVIGELDLTALLLSILFLQSQNSFFSIISLGLIQMFQNMIIHRGEQSEAGKSARKRQNSVKGNDSGWEKVWETMVASVGRPPTVLPSVLTQFLF